MSFCWKLCLCIPDESCSITCGLKSKYRRLQGVWLKAFWEESRSTWTRPSRGCLLSSPRLLLLVGPLCQQDLNHHKTISQYRITQENHLWTFFFLCVLTFFFLMKGRNRKILQRIFYLSIIQYSNYYDHVALTLLLSLPQKKELVSVQVFAFLLRPGCGCLKERIYKTAIRWIILSFLCNLIQ